MLLHEVLERAAAGVPDRVALIVDGAKRTFSEVMGDVARLARGLVHVSAPRDVVAILAPNGYAYPLAYYGVPKAGRVLLPLNQRLHPLEWASQLGRARATVLIADDALLAQLVSLARLPDSVRTVVTLGGHGGDLSLPQLLSMGDLAADDAALPVAHAQDPAWLLYTSGSTGRPKGVLLTHSGLLAGVRHSAMLRPLRDDDVFLTAFPLCHVAGYQVIVAHDRARPAVILRRFDADDFVAAVRDHQVSTCSLAPTMMDLLLEHVQGRPEDLEVIRRQLRAIGYGSAPMPAALIRRLTDVLGCDLSQGYGMTELGGNVTVLSAAEHRAGLSAEPQLLASVGRPGPLARLAIMDPTGKILPAGAAGEIVVRGEQVCAGYHDDPPATAEAMAGGWFHTGDLGVLGPDGRLTVIDRLKDIIVTGGENVSSREVEDVLRELPGVSDAAVVGIPDERWGERVCAVVVAEANRSPTATEVISGCRARLAGFKTPRVVTFVDALPRTASGKVSKGQLRAQLQG